MGTRQTLGVHGCHVLRSDAQRADVRGWKEAQSPAAGTMGDMEFSEVPDEYIDPIVDQTMMDDYTLYEYLTDADTEIYK